MPIIGLTDRAVAFPQIGSIRKGAAKDPAKNQPGSDLHHFRIDLDEQEKEAAATLLKMYGDKPNDIAIIMPFDTIEQTWDAWREAYTAGALIHRCDGEYVQYEIDPKTGESIVRNGLDANGQRVKCALKSSPNKVNRCKPTGRLNVVIPALARLAYLVVHTTSIHDILNISRQLDAIRNINNGHIAGIPLLLRRRPVEISTPSGIDGKRARREKWLISIEADPKWVAAKISAMNAAALPNPAMLQITSPSTGPDLGSLTEYEDTEVEDETEEVVEGETETALPLSGQEFMDWIKTSKISGKDVHSALGESVSEWISHNKGGYPMAAKTVAAFLQKPA